MTALDMNRVRKRRRKIECAFSRLDELSAENRERQRELRKSTAALLNSLSELERYLRGHDSGE